MGQEPPELPPTFSVSGTIFAFATVENGSPRVFRYPADHEGLESLANLIRSEHVLCVVRGTELPVFRRDVVEVLNVGDWVSSLTLEE
jgi:hypothetical protein